MASAVSSFMAWALLALMDGVGLPREVRLGFVAQQVWRPTLHNAHHLCCKPADPDSSRVTVLLLAWGEKLPTNSKY